MKSASPLTLSESAPLYIRWNPDRARHAVEMRLDLVERISGELAQAERMGVEVGGMLLGTLPTSDAPTLRVDEVAMIGRRFEDGAIYMIEPGQQHRFVEIRESAQHRGRVPVGFFRSHLRPGPLQPSMADKLLLTEQLGQNDYVFLLIQSREPRTACIYVASDGELPAQPSVRRFFFADSEFKFLPEVAVEETPKASTLAVAEQTADQRYRWLTVAGIAALAILLILGAFAGGISRLFRPAANKLDLSATMEGDILHISWDNNAPFLNRAKGAVITVIDGASRREIRLGADELKAGRADYKHETMQVEISLVLEAADANTPPQTFNWRAP